MMSDEENLRRLKECLRNLELADKEIAYWTDQKESLEKERKALLEQPNEEETAEFMKAANEWASSFVSDWDLQDQDNANFSESEKEKLNREVEEYELEIGEK